MTMEIGKYLVELRNSGKSTKWCVYVKRTNKRNQGSNLVLQIPADKTGVPSIIPKGQQKKRLTIIIEERLGGEK